MINISIASKLAIALQNVYLWTTENIKWNVFFEKIYLGGE